MWTFFLLEQQMPDKNIVIDVSHWNGTPNWTRLAQAGVVAAWLKCTNGAHDIDGQYKRNFDNATAAGIKVGSYHFLLSSQDPDQQAENFLKALEWNQDLLPALDCEWDLKGKHDRWLDVPLKSRIAMIGRWIAHVKKALGVQPIIYTATSWWRPMIGDAIGYQDVKFADSPLCG
jgi:lysozyme